MIKLLTTLLLSILAINCANAIVILPHNNTMPEATVTQLKQQIKYQQTQLTNGINRLVNLKTQLAILQSHLTKHNGFRWQAIKPGDKTPKGAFIAAHNGKNPVYICQAPHYYNTLYPGQWSAKGCIITYAGKQLLITDKVKLLISKKTGHWIDGDKLPSAPQYGGFSHPPYPFLMFNAQNRHTTIRKATETKTTRNDNSLPIFGGYENGRYLYICRSHYQGTWYIGKVVGGNCMVHWQGKEAALPNYQVLFGV